MTGIGALLLSALAGLNPWVVLVIVVGLNLYTRHAPVNPEFAGVGTTAGLVVIAAVLGVDVVLSKLRRAARFIEPVNAAAATVAGALIPLALVAPPEAVVAAGDATVSGIASVPPTWLAAPGVILAVASRYGRHVAARWMNTWLRPYGHVAASMSADLVAGCFTAAVFVIKP